MNKINTTARTGYTLIEIMVSVTLSLLLLLGVTQMFRNVGDTINETQATLIMTGNLNSAAIVLRTDVGGIIPDLAKKAADFHPTPGPLAGTPGYFEIIEGTGAPPGVLVHDHDITTLSGTTLRRGMHISPKWTAFSPDSPDGLDRTVIDNDDILAFTVNSGGNFRGFVKENTLIETPQAEIVWFVRGTNLYRRVLLTMSQTDLQQKYGISTPSNEYVNQDLSIRDRNPGTATLNELGDLELRQNRFGRPSGTSFPFPTFPASVANGSSWYYLRMPTMEETAHPAWGYVPALTRTKLQCGEFDMSKFPDLDSASSTYNQWGIQIGSVNYNQFWDYWKTPNDWSVEELDGGGNPIRVPDLDPVTGSICRQPDPINAGQFLYVQNPRSSRAGEDIILTNVIGFDVKVWNPYWVPCPGNTTAQWAPPQFVDLGQDRFVIDGTERDVNYAHNLTSNLPAPANQVGYGFTLKGRYNTVLENTNTRRVDPNAGGGAGDEWHQAERVETPAGSGTYQIWTGPHMACVYDSWSYDYMDPTATPAGNPTHLPPYPFAITGIQVTIRCFEPQSGTIKQIRITRFFN